MIVQQDCLEHTGVLGMHWGKSKTDLKKTSKNKKKLYIDTKKLIVGRNLTETSLRNIGTMSISNIVGSYMYRNGHEMAGRLISIGGTYIAVTDSIADLAVRTHR